MSSIINPGGASAMTLLQANSGTSTSAGATNVDTVAISGLTVKDSLLVIARLSSITQTTNTPQLQNVTDNVLLADLGSSNLTAGRYLAGDVTIAPDQSAATTILATYTGLTHATAGTQAGEVSGTRATVTTPWTGTWTLGLRHGGVTAGGTLRWQWAVYKIAGQ